MKEKRDYLWTSLMIEIGDKNIEKADFDICFSLVEDFENKYSRFKKDSLLSNINKLKQFHIDDELKSMLTLCNKVSDLTDGYFDITLQPILENMWYGIEEVQLEEQIWYKNIQLSGNTLRLKNWVSIDLGAVGKWYILDIVYNHLDKRYSEFVLNFGGDIRIKWKKEVYLEDPNDTTKSIWVITLQSTSIASSSKTKRTFGWSHHLINPKEKVSVDDKLCIYVTHKLGSFADIFATALFVTPLEKSLDILEKIDWLEALIIIDNWEIYKTRGFNSDLYTT